MNTHGNGAGSGAAAPTAASGQVQRMREAIAQVVTLGPRFLDGGTDADHMAHTMVDAVRRYAQQEHDLGYDGAPHSVEATQLQQVLAELMACGSGYLAQRCDAACVARTINYMVHEFGTQQVRTPS
ncbi:MAG: hypothetical protein DWB45_08585 [Xanthomonadales bacterium]|nr:hypothetical protein [Xanthomonadales bacterium]MDL1869683.1 hypothetical protein [Gammaproteobacteria bacterium PRO6]